MTQDLPRVTYSNIGTDFTPVHDHLDALLPAFEAEVLGQTWTTEFATGPLVDIRSPLSNDIVMGRFPTSTAEDVAKAVAKAKAAQKTWNKTSLEERLAFAARWRDVLAEDKYQLALACLFEVGKSRIEALGEAEEAVDMLIYYPEELRKNNGYTQPMNQLVPNETAVSVLKPYGTFAVVAPFNFSVALSIGMITGALITGNAVVYKPSPECQLTGLMLAETLRKAGLPEGVLTVVLGGAEVGRALTEDPRIDGVAFTGSHKTGMGIFRHFAVNSPWMKPVNAEMGGKNPAYVTAKADIKRAAQGVVRSAFGLQGQKCSACSVVFVDKAVKEEFIAEFKAFAATLKVGDTRERDVFMGPLYNVGTVSRFTSAMEQARAEGVVHFGGEQLDLGPNYFRGALVEMPAPSRLSKDEMFMPFVVLREVESLEQALAEGNDIPYGLSAGIFSQDPEEVQYFLDNAEAGVLYANRSSGATTGAWPGGQPFAGWKGTGLSGKGGLGAWYLPQFLREQSHTIMTV